MRRQPGTTDRVERDFPAHVAEHEMTIRRDDGVNRNICFASPRTSNRWFDLTTWPGYLCFSGDMGCYVFTRVSDMFDFFRGKGKIDYRYWAEKVVGVDRNTPILEFSQQDFMNSVASAYKEYARDLDKHDRKRLLAEIREALESLDYSEKRDHIEAMMNIKFDGRYPFESFYEYSCSDYTHGFVWACQAIRWGVTKYDQHKKLALLAS